MSHLMKDDLQKNDSCCHFGPILQDGKVIGHYWSCKNTEESWIKHLCEDQQLQMEYEEERRKTKLHDPERRFKNQIRHKRTIQLGRKVNDLCRDLRVEQRV